MFEHVYMYNRWREKEEGSGEESCYKDMRQMIILYSKCVCVSVLECSCVTTEHLSNQFSEMILVLVH